MPLVSNPTLDFNPFPLPVPPRTQALESTTFKAPPLDGSLSLAEMYDWHYYNTPDHPVFVFPDDHDVQPKVLKWPEVARAITHGARMIKKVTRMDYSPETDNIVAIFAASDTFTYFTLIAATFRAGLVPFMISPRNSPAAVSHLLSATQTAHVIVGPEAALQATFQSALTILRDKDASFPLPTYSIVPGFDELYTSDDAFQPLPPYKPPLNKLAFILHSSGSTAFPKPIGWSHLQLMQLCLVPYLGDRDLTGVRISCHALPMFHGMGMMQTLFTASMGIVVTSARPQVPAIPPTPDNVLASSKATNADIILCVPAFVEAWSRSDDTINYLSHLDAVVYGGGPLTKTVGDLLTRRGVNIFVLYGCTEIGIMTPVFPRSSDFDWEYFKPSQNARTVFIPDGHGHHELVVLPSPIKIPCVINGKYDGIDAYYTNDLFIAHPTKPGYYKVFGRADDQIMHNTGEKTNPSPLENILNQDPRVLSTVMFGREKFNVGVLFDLKPEYKFDPSDTIKLAEFRNSIWPTVERMNAYAPQHSRLFKEMILVSLPNKPFDYTAKNTARRQAIINKYDAEIQALYRSVEDTTQNEVTPPLVWNTTEVRQFVTKVVDKVMGVHRLADDDDLFQQGCDSLQATWIRNTLLRAIRDSTRLSTNTVPENLVYQFPTISKLTAFAIRFASRASDASLDEQDYLKLAVKNMENMVGTYSANFPSRPIERTTEAGDAGEVFLLTGSTGSLGASLLVDILKAPSTVKVYALNRPGRGTLPLEERQSIALKQIGFDPNDVLNSPRLVLVEADTAESNIGLTSVLVEEIRASVTHIILNAWPVDFNLSLQSFEPSIKAVRNLVDLALSSSKAQPPKVTYVSSIGVLSHNESPSHEAPAPPTPGTGYTQSKWVAESILFKAAAATQLPVAVVRVGQICGGVNGYWKRSDWLPAIVKSSKALDCFPNFDSDQVVSWVPPQDAALIVRELATASHEHGQVFHLVHPNPVSATLVSQTIANKLDCPLVPYSEWLERLESRATDGIEQSDLQVIPALRMLPFFRSVKAGNPVKSKEAWGLPSLETSQTQEASSSFASILPIDESDVERWIESWVSTGFL